VGQYRYLTIGHDGGTLTCTMANPPHHTLVAPEVTELREFLAAVEADPTVRVVVFTGAAEGIFISHYDIGELAAGTDSQAWLPQADDPEQLHALNRLILAMRRSRLITVAAINGSTLGGGLEFALGCDFRLAQDGPFQLGCPETSFGLIPGAGGTQCFVRWLGAARALDLILHGTVLSPREALDLGLVHRVYAPVDFKADVATFATNLASRAPVALAAAKRAIYDGADRPIEQALAVEQSQLERCMRSEDAAVAMRSFLRNEPWTWKGR
jgi:enoyl-CoA hydratase